MSHEGQTGVFFASGGNKLIGSLFLAPGDEPKPTALLLHGLPGIEKNYDLAHALRARGWNTLIFHYRGSWGSEGDYRFATLADDVRVALDYLSSGAHEQVDPNRLALVGHSMGGWAAVKAGADERVRAVAVIGAVTEPSRLPFTAALAKESFTPFLNGITPEEFDAQWKALDGVLEEAGRLDRPLLIVHAADDSIVPVVQAQLLHDASGGRARLEIHPEANHAFVWHRRWLIDQVVPWLDEAVH
ncbi:MAG TPA: alpha/beta fold hydrolase [Actinomycetota bacterium]|nr:alpha/beta fold hydrolase [Actinomycetota bacterium]